MSVAIGGVGVGVGQRRRMREVVEGEGGGGGGGRGKVTRHECLNISLFFSLWWNCQPPSSNVTSQIVKVSTTPH